MPKKHQTLTLSKADVEDRAGYNSGARFSRVVLRVGDVAGGALRVYEAVLESNLDGNTPRKHHRAFIQNTNLADTISPI